MDCPCGGVYGPFNDVALMCDQCCHCKCVCGVDSEEFVIMNDNTICTGCGMMYDNIDVGTESKYVSDYCTDICTTCRSMAWEKVMTDGAVVCSVCGVVKEDLIILDEKDWNNYTSTREAGIDNSRVGWFDTTNPANTLGTDIKKGTNCMFNCSDAQGNVFKKDLSRLQKHVSYSNKEQSYSRVIQRLQTYVPRHINKRILAHSVYIWTFIQNNSNIYRADVRKGILCNCIYQACLEITGCYRTKRSVKRMMKVSDESFQVGEKILSRYYAPMNNRDEQIDSQAIFSYIINQFDIELDYDFNYKEFVPSCIKVYEQCKDDSLGPEVVSLDTAIAGVIYYVFKKKIPKNMPTISKMKDILGVTNPTMRKACKRIIEQLGG